MEVIHLNFTKELITPISVALGYFDGLHLGHQAVIKEAVDYAKTHQMRSAVMTFSPSPNFFLKKLDSDRLLTPYQEKVRLLTQLGVDELIILPFNEELANMKATDFIEKYLLNHGVAHVSTGFDFRFGQMGEGDATLLATYSNAFTLNVTSKCELEDEKIGATEIKRYLSEGNIEKVTQMLGRPYQLHGTVVTGQQRGREIGFPTANLKLSDAYVIPKKGVYAVMVEIEGKEYMGMSNIGHNPTFNFNDQICIETNILNFKEDIYGKEITLSFYHYLREEKKFSSIEELMNQLNHDQQSVRSYFKLNLN